VTFYDLKSSHQDFSNEESNFILSIIKKLVIELLKHGHCLSNLGFFYSFTKLCFKPEPSWVFFLQKI
jgi:hypothetical protein